MMVLKSRQNYQKRKGKDWKELDGTAVTMFDREQKLFRLSSTLKPSDQSHFNGLKLSKIFPSVSKIPVSVSVSVRVRVRVRVRVFA
jgi:hypothetical protein